MPIEVVYPGAPLGVISAGTRVSVRSWPAGCCVPGFEIVGTVAEDNDILGYRVRRIVEGAAVRSRGPR